MNIGSPKKRLGIALLFLLPNLIGFLVFTAGPVVFSFVLSFTDMALTKHNQYSDNEVRFVGFQNYQRLLVGDEAPFFWDYFWNTVFLMIGIPISIAGSLALALMINAKATPQGTRPRYALSLAAAILTGAVCALAWIINTPDPSLAKSPSTETGLTDMTQMEVAELRRLGIVILLGLIGAVITSGLAVGQMFFRATFYLPTLLSGVAIFLLWKTLYRPRGGLINAFLAPVLDTLQATVEATPPILWYTLAAIIALAALAIIIKSTATGLAKLKHKDAGPASFMGRLTLSLTAAATLAGIAFVTAQLPANALFPSGHAPLTHTQLNAALDNFEQELQGQYDQTELDAIRASYANQRFPTPTARARLIAAAEPAPGTAPPPNADPVEAADRALLMAVADPAGELPTTLSREQFLAAARTLTDQTETPSPAAQALIDELNTAADYRDIASQLVSLAPEGQQDTAQRIAQNATTPVKKGLTAGNGLTPPEWLVSSDWAKTAIVIMGVWLTIGGANMLLYLAGLSNVPPELYEASAIDGASAWQRFIHVTWPQLAPTTFFIVIMSTIAGLQGGFEQALVMTQGNYDTIVLTYYLYNLAFDGNFQLGLASAVAWIMFAIIFAMTAVNFRFGSKLTNE